MREASRGCIDRTNLAFRSSNRLRFVCADLARHRAISSPHSADCAGRSVAITAYKLIFTGFRDGASFAGLGLHLTHEFSLLANLFLLLMGFALLSRHFEESAIPGQTPAVLPGDRKGGAVLLAIVFVLSSFLDNIAAAIIGGTVARRVFRDKVHIGYLAAIVAASNAGGSGSVVGDTTTTMMWVSRDKSVVCP